MSISDSRLSNELSERTSISRDKLYALLEAI